MPAMECLKCKETEALNVESEPFMKDQVDEYMGSLLSRTAFLQEYDQC